MKKENIYSSKNIFLLTFIFIIIFWLLYSLGSFLHEAKKIHDEIAAIREHNKKNLLEIEKKKQYLEYLKTPQRIEKEAKIQMGKKRPKEKSLFFIKEKLDILPTTKLTKNNTPKKDVAIIEKWKYLFFSK